MVSGWRSTGGQTDEPPEPQLLGAMASAIRRSGMSLPWSHKRLWAVAALLVAVVLALSFVTSSPYVLVPIAVALGVAYVRVLAQNADAKRISDDTHGGNREPPG